MAAAATWKSVYVGVSHVLPHIQSCATSSPLYPPAPFHGEPQRWPDSIWSSGAAWCQAGQYIKNCPAALCSQPHVLSLFKCADGRGLQHGGACRATVMPCLCCICPPAAKTCSRILGRCVTVVCSCVALGCCCTAAADQSSQPQICTGRELGAAPRSSRWPLSSTAAADLSCSCCPAGHPGVLRPPLHQLRASWLPGLAASRAPLPLSLRGRWLQPATAEGAGAAAAPAPRRPTGPASCPAARLELRSSTCPPRQLGPPIAPAGELHPTRPLQHWQVMQRLHTSSRLPQVVLQIF